MNNVRCVIGLFVIACSTGIQAMKEGCNVGESSSSSSAQTCFMLEDLKTTPAMEAEQMYKTWKAMIEKILSNETATDADGGYIYADGKPFMLGKRKSLKNPFWGELPGKKEESAPKKSPGRMSLRDMQRKSGPVVLKEGIAGQYKIHLMPTDDSIDGVVKKLLMLIKNNKDLQQVVNKIKISNNYGETMKHPVHVFPRIVIYTADGKNSAQKALNILYDAFETIHGMGIRPRFNAKVTDLIYIAQGDADLKDDQRFAEYFEQPDKVYYDPKKVPPEDGKDHYLRFPGTDKPIKFLEEA